MIYENKSNLITAVSNGNTNKFKSLLKEYGEENFSIDVFNDLIYYSARNGKVETCEYIIDTYNNDCRNILVFSYKDSLKKMHKLIQNINKEKNPHLFNYKDHIIQQYLTLCIYKDYYDNFGLILFQMVDKEKRNELYEHYINYFKAANTFSKKKFANSLKTVYRDYIVDDLLS